MRKVAASCVVALAAACSSEDYKPASASADTVLIGRVVASHELVTFVGDLAYDSYAHVVAPRDSGSARVILLSRRIDCPRPGSSNQLYKMTIRETDIPFGITSEEDQAWLTKFEIMACQPHEE